MAMAEHKLIMSKELTEKCGKEKILKEDILSVIEALQRNGNKLIDTEKDCFTGHGKVGNMTLWVSYRETDGGFEVLSAYAHRMCIVEG